MKRLGIIAAVAACAMLSGCWTTIPSGQKNGILTKFAQQGAFCQTWEGELVRGGLNGGSGVMGAPFDFTVEDKGLVEKIKTAFDNQQEVRITYHKEAMSFCRSESHSYFLDAVEVIGPPKLTITAPDGSTKTVMPNGTSATLGVERPTGGTTLSAAQVDRMLDQNDRLIKAIEKRAAR